eukprot:Gregarina_sp_Poly_1__9122@NODE_55_length_17436_cov_154_331798_g47_i0_p7_GENE_NODE_55_length_17436_cov_154_331798_g47_i0NODE_55_length_17436_cov_154_331798_g47_i0_p7_ORF_typecomplete_len343_score49_89PfkB/PF00294_24/2_3e50Phos_pyr_kin/PF08543_12/1_7e05PHY/PF00360_20/2_5PHY/PF00360_20/91_NODE_55_length_17436_cov_154_331798_g47_i01125812286
MSLHTTILPWLFAKETNFAMSGLAMAKNVLNFGSINLDIVYRVHSLVSAGETILSRSLQTFFGGKGLNQSVALARAQAQVCHAGCVGSDGVELVDFLRKEGVDVCDIAVESMKTGHAIIQVSDCGENAIVLHGGANQCLTRSYAETCLQRFRAQAEEKSQRQFVLTQNETNLSFYILEQAKAAGFSTIWNPAPCPTEHPSLLPLKCVDFLILNRHEAAQLTGETVVPEMMRQLAAWLQPTTTIVITLGGDGVVGREPIISESNISYKEIQLPAFSIPNVVDTTAAGDTFVGYFIASLAEGSDLAKCLRIASAAAGLSIQTSGAAPSIPTIKQVTEYLGGLDN